MLSNLRAVRKQTELTRSLYERRSKIVSQIPGFWPLVFEQAPPDIDEYIQPTDSALLLSSLTALSVSRFEIEDGGNGDPRSVSIRFEFAPNDWLEDAVIEKKFWYRRSKDGWSGLVSEPVEIRWKEGKDLTQGLLGLAKRVWEEEKAAQAKGEKTDSKELTKTQKELQEEIETIGLGGVSFFAWFGYAGKMISAEESQAATEQENEVRKLQREGKEIPESLRTPEKEKEEGKEGDDDDDEDSLEIFPDGDSLAIALSDDLWPGAVKYFSTYNIIRSFHADSPSEAHCFFPTPDRRSTDTAAAQAQEQDPASDFEFESIAGDLESDDDEDEDEEERPAKKVKV